MADYEVGYGKPPEHGKWKPGVSGNPGGLTKEQIEQRRRNRDRAMAIEEKLLTAVEKDLDEREQAALEHVRSDVLRLIHTAIERNDGKPTQQVDQTSSDGSARLPQRIILSGPEDADSA